MERRFRCTACGKCCTGWLPLTLKDALAQADKLPLAMVWTPVRESSPQFALAQDLGLTVPIERKKKVAVLIVPTAYLPPTWPCPALMESGLCSIQDQKPLRCKTMPLSPYREEAGQDDLLVPRAGWLCDTSETAPVLYKNKALVDRLAFDQEKAALRQEAEALRLYGEKLLKTNAAIARTLAQTVRNAKGGHFIVSFSSFLRLRADADLIGFAKKQQPVLSDFAGRTAAQPEESAYHAYYRENATDLEWFAKKA